MNDRHVVAAAVSLAGPALPVFSQKIDCIEKQCCYIPRPL
jgi:hypothetical protein